MTSGNPQHPASPEVTDHLAALGVHGRPARLAIGLLADGWQTLPELIRRSALPRRSVEELLTALDADLERDGDQLRLRRDRISRHQPLAAAPRHAAPSQDDQLAQQASADPTVAMSRAPDDRALAAIASDIAAGPSPTPAMDHVPADADTVLRRARWLTEHYVLDGARLLVLGDHDLTSLAVCALQPGLAVTVVDLDDRVLAHVDRLAAERGHDIRCLHADFRFGLPPLATGWADLVFSDPPYTPEGMALFASRGVEALRDPVSAGRLVLAYGYSTRSPALGLKVQQELLRAGLVFESILPGFHRYHGAQAIGSAADLYVCQPTVRPKGSPAHRGKAGRPSGRTGIYTHGPQSVESAAQDTETTALTALHEHAAEGGRRVLERAPGWARPLAARADETVAMVLAADPGPWLLRTLLATNADQVVLLVPNNHPDLVSESSQQALSRLLRSKYRLRFLRSKPGPAHAIVLATAAPHDELAPAERTANAVLHKAHGTLGNVWREALITASGNALTKNQARDVVTVDAPPRIDLGSRLIDLPRHQLVELLTAITPD